MNSLDEFWYVCIVWASEGPTGDLSRPRRSTFVAEWKFFVVVEQVVLEWDSILFGRCCFNLRAVQKPKISVVKSSWDQRLIPLVVI